MWTQQQKQQERKRTGESHLHKRLNVILNLILELVGGSHAHKKIQDSVRGGAQGTPKGGPGSFRESKPKVHQIHLAVIVHHIVPADVAVQVTLPVDVFEGRGKLPDLVPCEKVKFFQEGGEEHNARWEHLLSGDQGDPVVVTPQLPQNVNLIFGQVCG